MAHVKIGFSRGTSLIAKLICFVTDTDISHSFFYVRNVGEDGVEEEWVYEAVPRGFRKCLWMDYKRFNDVKAMVDVAWPHDDVKARLDSMLGKPYPIARFFWNGIRLLFHRTPTRTPMENAADCVMSCAVILLAYGHSVDAVTPGELARKMLGK